MLRRRSKVDRVTAEVKGVSPLGRTILAVVAATGLVVLTYIARRNLWRAIAVFADAVEEVADTVEDAAEDVSDAARARAEKTQAS